MSDSLFRFQVSGSRVMRKWAVIRSFCQTLAAFMLWSSSSLAQGAGPLSLQDVLDSALRSHPKMAEARAGLEEARARVLSARGAFDLSTYASGSYAPVGKYDKARGEVGLKQPTAAWGLELYAKYENGEDFAPYDGQYVTSSIGKVSVGALLPLVRGRAIDGARFARLEARLQESIAEQELRATRAQVLADATSLWWKWLVTGKKLEAYRALVEQAESRQEFLVEQSELGAIAPVEAVDNSRLLASRRAQLAALELEFRQVCLRVGLYRRDERDDPVPASASELPRGDLSPAVAPAGYEHLLERLREGPGLSIYESAIDMLDQELRLEKNNQLPQLDFSIYSTKSFGDPRPYSTDESSVTETTVGGNLALSWDVQRRKSRGKAQVVRAKRRALQQKSRLLLDRLTLDLHAQLAALEAQTRISALSREATEQAEKVSAAERISFEAGQSSVLSVNLREQAVLQAYITELDAVYQSRLAWIELRRIIGSDGPEEYIRERTTGAGEGEGQ